MARGGSGALVSVGGARAGLSRTGGQCRAYCVPPGPVVPPVVCCRALVFSLRGRWGAGRLCWLWDWLWGTGVRYLSCSPVRSCFGQVAGLVHGIVLCRLCVRSAVRLRGVACRLFRGAVWRLCSCACGRPRLRSLCVPHIRVCKCVQHAPLCCSGKRLRAMPADALLCCASQDPLLCYG